MFNSDHKQKKIKNLDTAKLVLILSLSKLFTALMILFVCVSLVFVAALKCLWKNAICWLFV